MAFDEKFLKCMMEQNSSSIKTFVELMFSGIRNELKEICEENVELIKESRVHTNRLKRTQK